MQQIARALTGNALVHTPPGTTVRLRVERRGSRVALAVEDDGPGIPPEHLDRVFQRFYRVEGGQASGSGLGLAIARELAGRMGGTVTVDEHGRGCDGVHARVAGRRRGAAPARAALTGLTRPATVSTWKRAPARAVAERRNGAATVIPCAPRSSPLLPSPRSSAPLSPSPSAA